MPSLSVLTLVIACQNLFVDSEAVAVEILKPIRSTGDEAGLIFIPNTFIKGEQYKKTAQAIQEASELRVWVALTKGFVPDPQQVPDIVNNAISLFKKAGITTINFVGVGHGVGGFYLQANETLSQLKAIILMGSTLPREAELQKFPVPVLTLAAELDGLTRITRVVEEYLDLNDDAPWTFFLGLYKTPIVCLEGANHAQFASGEMPNYIKSGDLAANVSEEDAHAMIGQHINSFLTVTFSSIESQTNIALEQLINAFVKTVKKFQPFVDVKYLDTDGRESMWTVLAQQYFAGELENRTAIYNDIFKNPEFFSKRPVLETFGKAVIAGTATLIHAQDKTSVLQHLTPMESPMEIDMKLVSKNAIKRALDGADSKSVKSKSNTCKSLNRLALAIALVMSTPTAMERYYSTGKQIIFEEDAMQATSFFWSISPLQLWEDDSGLHVKSIAMVTPDFHFCKVISPYRAMEWVNIDSLRR